LRRSNAIAVSLRSMARKIWAFAIRTWQAYSCESCETGMFSRMFRATMKFCCLISVKPFYNPSVRRMFFRG
jgi:hypothetical protein